MALTRKKKIPPKLYIGEWIARLERKQAHVAKAAGITPAYLSEICSRKKYPSAAVLYAIAKALGLNEVHLQSPPLSKTAVEAVERLEPDQLATLGRLLDEIKNPPPSSPPAKTHR